MAKKIVRRPADAAGVGPYARERERLVPLSTMNGWDVVDGEADIRSWEVKTVSGRVLGHVRELLIDASAGEVVMLDVDIAGSDRHAYLPIRLVELDRSRRVVRADSGDIEEHDADTPAISTRELEGVRHVRYADSRGERIVERRPVVEETVVRRRMSEEEKREGVDNY